MIFSKHKTDFNEGQKSAKKRIYYILEVIRICVGIEEHLMMILYYCEMWQIFTFWLVTPLNQLFTECLANLQ